MYELVCLIQAARHLLSRGILRALLRKQFLLLVEVRVHRPSVSAIPVILQLHPHQKIRSSLEAHQSLLVALNTVLWIVLPIQIGMSVMRPGSEGLTL